MNLFKLFLTLILSLSVTVFVSCTGSSSAKPNEKVGGTGDGGGGTGLDSKIFEQYILSKEKILQQNPKLGALLKTLEQRTENLPIHSLQHSIEYVLTYKKWFFIPAKVKSIDSSKMGLGTGENAYEQYAFQNDREVWINKDSFEKMDEQGRFSLLVHEIFLDLYLKSKIIQQFESEDSSVASVLPEFCVSNVTLLNKNDFAKICSNQTLTANDVSQYSRLKSEDYGPIRSATSAVLALQDSREVVGLIGKLVALGYSDKVLSRPVSQNPQREAGESVKALNAAVSYTDAMKEVLSCTYRKGPKTIESAVAQGCGLSVEQKDMVNLQVKVGAQKSKVYAFRLASKALENGMEEKSMVSESSYIDAIDQSLNFAVDTFFSEDKESVLIQVKTSWSRTESVEVWDRSTNETWTLKWKLPKVQGFNF